MNLTPKQRDLLQYVYACLCEHGRQPSYREMAQRFGWKNPNAACAHLTPLRRKGYVATEGSARGLRLLRWPDGSPFRGLRAAETDPLPFGRGEPETSEVNP